MHGLKKIFYNMNVKFLVFKELDSVDIDNHEDLELAKKYLNLKKIINFIFF